MSAKQPKLEGSDVESNYIEALRRIKAAKLENLTELDLSEGGLPIMPPALWTLKDLEKLRLDGNQLTTLPKGLGELKALTALRLDNNQLTAVPKELGELKALTTLQLDNNQLTAVPKEMGELKALTALHLNNNQLTALPKELGGLRALERLHLDNNQLIAVPKELGELKALRVLILDNNRLTAVPQELGALKALTWLALDNNQLTAVPKGFRALRALKRLHLYSNQLTAVPKELGELKTLTLLTLDNNQLASVPNELGELKLLTTLTLNHNRLTAVPKQLGKLKALTTLTLDRNQLRALPRELGALKALEVLLLHDNPALGIPPEILGATFDEFRDRRKNPARPAEILAYYFARSDSTDRPLNEAKILVVGEPGVGKTMLVEWLVKGKARKNPEWTKGIQILPWKVPCAEGKGDAIKVNIWDFGGQEIMQATHQFFLTERSLYLLVLDSRENEEQSKLRYWLDKIRTFGGSSPVIVVLNRRDEGQYDPDESRLQKDYATNLHDRSFIRTACQQSKGNKAIKAGYGISDLREAITSAVQQLENVTQPVPANYLKAKEAFEKASKAQKRMDRKSFDAICKKAGLKDDLDRDTVLSYLKSLGALFHYKRGQQDHNTLVLDPEWLTGGVYKFLTDQAVKQRGGELIPHDVGRIFARSRTYPEEARQFILDMMEGDPFELSFQIPDTDGHRLIPELLPPNEPAHGIIELESLSVQYHYKFLPAGLIPRFIVRMHNVLSPGHAWKNGVIVNVDGRRVLIRGVREAKRVFVSAEGRGPAARRALAIVRHNLGMVHSAMRHLEVTEHVGLPEDPGITIPYNDLLQYEHDEGGDYEYRPYGAKRKYKIIALLDGIEEPAARREVFHLGTIPYVEDPSLPGTSVRYIPIDGWHLDVGTGSVFISYANEPDASHASRVRELADRLREQGVDASIDQYLGESGPGVGWPLWMKRMIQDAKAVLVVCSPTYLRRIEGKEEQGRGLGATYEGRLIQQAMYNNGVLNPKFRAVLLDRSHEGSIPLELQPTTHFKLFEPDGYEKLYRALTGQNRSIAPPLGKRVVMPPKP